MPDARAGQETGANPFGELVKLTVAAQERSMQLAQGWSDALLTTLKDASEDSRANLATLSSSLGAMEKALESQEETNKAIRRSLEGYREIVERYAAAQERTARLVQDAVDDLKKATQGQLEAARAFMTPPAAVAASAEPFTEMLNAWNAAVSQMLKAATPPAPKQR
jgi:hypothetical protein